MRKIARYAIFTLLFLTLSILTAFLIYVHFFRSNEGELSGEWTADLDMTERAAVTAFIWLQDIEGVSVSLEDVESGMQDLTVAVNMTMEQTGQSEGTFRCNIDPGSYEICVQAGYEAFAVAFRELVAERLGMAGYTGGTDEEAVEALVVETFGMSTVSYLRSSAPALLPPLEEMQAEYDGSGSYEATEGMLVRQFDAEGMIIIRREYYIRKDDRLILSEKVDTDISGIASDHYPIIYRLIRSEDQ